MLAPDRVGRDINRRYYTREEVERALEQPVVACLLELIRLRNSHPAFAGVFDAAESPDDCSTYTGETATTLRACT